MYALVLAAMVFTGQSVDTVTVPDSMMVAQYPINREPVWSSVYVQRGDVNGDGKVSIGDISTLIGYVFLGKDLPVISVPEDSADAVIFYYGAKKRLKVILRSDVE